MATIKTIDIQQKTWRDKLYGNSYHSIRVIIDYGMETERTIYGPFRYMTSLEQYAQELLGIYDLWDYRVDSDIIIRRSTEADLQRNVKAWGRA